MDPKYQENGSTSPSLAASSGPNTISSGVEGETKADLDEEKENVFQKTETLGVLLVHGIGSQRRGDTLVHCVTALHNWIRAWHSIVSPKMPLTFVELIDANVAEAGSDHPAHVKLILRRLIEDELSRHSCLVAESSWFETYRRPGFYEFMRWAFAVLPTVILTHFLPNYRRTWKELDTAARAGKTGILSFLDGLATKRGLAPLAPDEAPRDLRLTWRHTRLELRLFAIQMKVTLALAVGFILELLLLVIAVLTIVPGITRSFAGWVQRKVSGTLGDSYLFLTSPITRAAIDTRVKKDLEWLTARSDRVIVLAHSQGAAVSYHVIDQQFWDGRRPQKPLALVTYGSGLGKLFELQWNVSPEPPSGTALVHWNKLALWLIVTWVMVAAPVALLLTGVIPWWAAVAGLVVGILSQIRSITMVGRDVARVVPGPMVLRVPWYDLYSSHDLVPNGAIEVQTHLRGAPSPLNLPEADREKMPRFVKDFESRQHQVVNRRWILRDHTSYWSSGDDFVARIWGILAKEGRYIPICRDTLDKEWLKVSTARRLWRVTWLSQCRAVTGLAALSILVWPRDVLERPGSYVSEVTRALVANLPAQLAAWVPDHLHVPGRLLGALVLMLGTYLMYLVASLGWGLWESKELKRFFHRNPYSSPGIAGWIFALGWVGVVASAPAYALAHAPLHWDGLLAVFWAPFALAAWSIWKLSKSDRGPGTPLEWSRILLAHAEQAIADERRDRTEALSEARRFFIESRHYLEMKHSGSDDWARAVLGEARAVEELAKYDSDSRSRAPEIYQKAIEDLERTGRDASEVRALLERAGIAPIQ